MPNRADEATEYRKGAKQCREQAASARKPEDKAHWLKLSEDYQRLAENVERSRSKLPPST